MPRHLTWVCAVMCIALGPASGTTPAGAASPATKAVSASDQAISDEIRQLRGKVVRIYHGVNLQGAGKPSALHTAYLAMLLGQAGATVVRGSADDMQGQEQRADVVILGELAAPAPLDPAEAADPFIAHQAKMRRQEADRYEAARPALEKAAADAGARVIQSKDVAAALGIRVTEEEIVAALDARARQALERVLPDFKADAVTLADIIDFLRDVSRANIFVNWRALEAAGVDRNAPLTINLSGIPLSEALENLLALPAGGGAKLAYTVNEGVIVISTDDDLKNKDK